MTSPLDVLPQTPPAGPRPEYPRPDRDRSHRWLSLNGTWDLETEDDVVPVVVPFAWETSASGVGRTWLERATYRRRVSVPAGWTGCRVVLCFGAVHHEAQVLLDGHEVARHEGGYTSFEIDVTDHLAPGSEAGLEVRVHAPADKRSIPHGKQRSIPRTDYDGVCFTPTSGIWQSVWLEGRGSTYVEHAGLEGDSLTGFDLTGRLAGPDVTGTRITARVVSGSSSFEHISLVCDDEGRFHGRLEIADARVWSPADPHLYGIELVTDGEVPDVLTLTSGLRRIQALGEELWLNGSRLYVRGVLDQGYWPLTGLTAPDDAALVRDLEIARDLGYNLVRKHLKLEDPRWLHHADRMGMLVWAEPPAASRFSAGAVRAFENQLPALVERDGNHPSIVVWGLYNEEWGLDWDIPHSPDRARAARQAYEAMRALDETRPIVENSGWSHVLTDLVDWHYYDEDLGSWARTLAQLASGEREDFPVRLGADFVVDKPLYGNADHPRHRIPLLNSEYGTGYTSLERAWNLRWQTQELRRHDRFAGYVYTELTDIEHEMAGLLDYDRRAKDLGGLDPSDVNAETVLVVDLVPAAAGADIPLPTADLELAVHVSHHGATSLTGRLNAAWAPANHPANRGLPSPEVTTDVLTAVPFTLTAASTLAVRAPLGKTAARLWIWLTDSDNRGTARTFVDAAPVEEPNRRGARTTPTDHPDTDAG
ncbi:glycoside hydrolase family 2 protein [Kineosporia succinea]|uniref:Glycosyl hydrolase family 2 n=1 Tax=Kineosporia succinea TaxID=84632 RepID=A0ABT9PC14_9ACTN|nr:glycoside hydrolase family 2 TIM barrel-domain containing protein [Kineosporia succinea]MDP9830254.1 hypothetical protein [Kineosporia succinea]